MKSIFHLLLLTITFNLSLCVNSYDYYVLALEWAGSLCETEDCSNTYAAGLNYTFFNIHGMWPSVFEGE